jgi:hypothetical protein
MANIRKARVWLVFAVLTLLMAARVIAQDKEPQKDPPKDKKPALLDRKPLKADPKDDELRKLQIARYNEAIAELQEWNAIVERGQTSPHVLFEAAVRVTHAGLEVYDKPDDRINLLTEYVELTRMVEKVFETRAGFGVVSKADVDRATYNRIDAEIQLLKAKRSLEKPKDK